MTRGEKTAILAWVETLVRRRRQELAELGIARSSYYRWRRRRTDPPKRKRPWHRITPNEERRILAVARDYYVTSAATTRHSGT